MIPVRRDQAKRARASMAQPRVLLDGRSKAGSVAKDGLVEWTDSVKQRLSVPLGAACRSILSSDEPGRTEILPVPPSSTHRSAP